jgi:hypothetical protein
LLDALSDSISSSGIFTTKHYSQDLHAPSDRDFRLLLHKLSESIAKGDITLEQAYGALWPSAPNMTGRDRGEGACHQVMGIAHRIPGTIQRGKLRILGERFFVEPPNIADRAMHRNEIQNLSSSRRLTIENYDKGMAL